MFGILFKSATSHHFAPAGSGLVPGFQSSFRKASKKNTYHLGEIWRWMKMEILDHLPYLEVIHSCSVYAFPKIQVRNFSYLEHLKFWQSHETAANKSTYLLAQQLLQEFCPSAVDNPPRSVWCPCQCNGYERRVDASRMMSAFFFQKMEVEVQVSCYNL